MAPKGRLYFTPTEGASSRTERRSSFVFILEAVKALRIAREHLLAQPRVGDPVGEQIGEVAVVGRLSATGKSVPYSYQLAWLDATKRLKGYRCQWP